MRHGRHSVRLRSNSRAHTRQHAAAGRQPHFAMRPMSRARLRSRNRRRGLAVRAIPAPIARALRTAPMDVRRACDCSDLCESNQEYRSGFWPNPIGKNLGRGVLSSRVHAPRADTHRFPMSVLYTRNSEWKRIRAWIFPCSPRVDSPQRLNETHLYGGHPAETDLRAIRHDSAGIPEAGRWKHSRLPLESTRIAGTTLGEYASMAPCWKRHVACLTALLILCPWGPANSSFSADAHCGTTGNALRDHLEAVVTETLPVCSGDRPTRPRTTPSGTTAVAPADACALACRGSSGPPATLEILGKPDATGGRSLFSLHCLLTL